jgi:hypothetical protein
LIALQTNISKKQEINMDIIKASTKAGIHLEKIEKLKPLFQKYYINDIFNFFMFCFDLMLKIYIFIN